ncbi:MAG: glycosyltransferase family 39 protein [bacterium]|nr:glycosyltransferase family 39 protein [bacterium]
MITDERVLFWISFTTICYLFFSTTVWLTHLCEKKGYFLKAESLAIFAMLICVISYFLIVINKVWCIPINELFVAVRILNGEKLYQNIQWEYGPLLPYFNAFLYKLWGVNYSVLHLESIIIEIILTGLVYYLSRRLTGIRDSLIISFIFMGFSMKGISYTNINSTHFTVFLSIVSLCCIVNYLQTNKLIWLLQAGFLSGISICGKYTLGIVSSFSIIIFFIFYKIVCSREIIPKKSFLIKHFIIYYLLPMILIPFCIYGYILLTVPLEYLLYNFYFFCKAMIKIKMFNSFYPELLSVFIIPKDLYSWLLYFLQSCPCFLVVWSWIYLIKVIIKKKLLLGSKVTLILILFLLFNLFTLTQVAKFLPSVIILIIFAIRMISLKFCQNTTMSFFLFLASLQLALHLRYNFQDTTHEIKYPTINAKIDPDHGETYKLAADYIISHTKPNEKILQCPGDIQFKGAYELMMEYLSRHSKQSTEKIILDLPGNKTLNFLTGRPFPKSIEDIKKGDVTYIFIYNAGKEIIDLYNKKSWIDIHGTLLFPPLDDYIMKNYSLVKVFEPTDTSSGKRIIKIAVFKRN